MSNIWKRKLIVIYAYCMASALMTAFFVLWWPILEDNPRCRIMDLINGTACRPFVYRRLPAAVIGTTANMMPTVIEKKLDQKLFDHPGIKHKNLMQHLNWKRDNLKECIMSVIFVYFCLLGTLYALRWLMAIVYSCSMWIYDVLPVGVMFTLPVFWANHKYIYDPSCILLSVLLIATLCSKKYWLYYIIFIVSVFNKETTILFLLVFAIMNLARMGKFKLGVHLIVQVVIYGAITYWIRSQFVGNPGGSFEYHLFDHNLSFTLLRHKIPMFLFVLCLGLFLRWGWYGVPKTIRISFITLLFCLVGLTLFFGWIEELRDYLEVIPFIALMAVPAICRVYGDKPTIRDAVA